MQQAFLITGIDSEARATQLAEQFPAAAIYGDFETASIDDTRAFREAILLSPTIESIVWYFGANRWGVEAQQAILKLCEEVPEKVDIVIGASYAGDLLPTLRSRLVASAAQPTAASGTFPKKISLESIDDYSISELVEYLSQKMRDVHDAKTLDRAEKILHMIGSKKLSEKQIKELIVLTF
jgi:hypothetical protein